MRTTEIINGLDKKELLKWEIETKSILNELNWKFTKTSRALHLHQSDKEECTEKLKSSRQRAAETRMVLQFLSANHPLRHKCEDDLYKTEISIFRLERKLQHFSNLKLIQLEIKKHTIASEIMYYEGVLQSIENMLRPPVVLRKILNIPDGEAGRNRLPLGKIIFLDGNKKSLSEPARNRVFQPTKDKISRRLEMTTLSKNRTCEFVRAFQSTKDKISRKLEMTTLCIRLKQEAIDVRNLFLSVG